MSQSSERSVSRVPLLSLVLGYGAMLPFAVGAAVAWLVDGRSAAFATDLVVLWGAAILTFLGGVRRGLSFRTAGGPTAAQIAVTLWLFGLGLAALVLATTWALLLLLAGYASLLVLDPWSARRGEVPLFFERLRPLQMAIPVASLGALLLLEL